MRLRTILVAGVIGFGCLTTPTLGQVHTLWGDFVVENAEATASLPQAFHVILKNLAEVPIQREVLGPRGRYRFRDVPNGDYLLVVEVEGTKMVELRIRVDELRSTDIRRDLAFEWSGLPEAAPGEAGIRFARNRSGQQRFDDAMADLERGKVKDATQKLEKLVQKTPDDFEAWTELGTAQFRAEKVEDARNSYRKATELRPDFTLAWLNLGMLEVTDKHYEDAVAALTTAIEKDPELAQAHYFLGEANLQLKKGSQAVQHFQKALELEPVKMADAHLRMGYLYQLAGYTDHAVKEYEAFLAKRPEYPQRQELEEFVKANKKP